MLSLRQLSNRLRPSRVIVPNLTKAKASLRQVTPHQITVSVFVTAAYMVPMRTAIWQGLVISGKRWRRSPAGAVADVIVSLIGQAFFWTVGQDFIGVFMKSKWKPGLGHLFARKIHAKLPENDWLAWALRITEIALDATKCNIEGDLFKSVQIIPDAWAYIVTQPVWSVMEASEKTSGMILFPERVVLPENVEDSISSMYGTLSRDLLSILVFKPFGHKIRAKLGRPIERQLHKVRPAHVALIIIGTAAIGYVAYALSIPDPDSVSPPSNAPTS